MLKILKNLQEIPDVNFRKELQDIMPTAFHSYGNKILLDIQDEHVKEMKILDVSSKDISTLKGIEYFKNLVLINCKYNHLKKLNLSKNAKLKTLFCSDNLLTELDVTKSSNLEYLECIHNNLSKLDVSKNPKLKFLYCHFNEIEELDISQNTQLEFLVSENNNLRELDISKNKKLKHSVGIPGPKKLKPRKLKRTL